MKKITLLLGLCLYVATVFSQTDAIEKNFSEYTDHEDFTSIYISQKMFGMLSDVNVEEDDAEEVLSIIKDLTGLRILTSEKPPKGFFKSAVKKLKSDGFVELMSVKENDQIVNFLVDEGQGDKIEELILITSEVSSLLIFSFKGDLSIDKISKLSKTLDIDGAEHLEKLKERN